MTDKSSKTLFDAANPPPTSRSPDYRVTYANNARLRMTNSDIQITFCQLMDSQAVGVPKVQIEEQSAIVMSPVQAKALNIALTRVIADYENKFGEIKILENAVAISDQLKKSN